MLNVKKTLINLIQINKGLSIKVLRLYAHMKKYVNIYDSETRIKILCEKKLGLVNKHYLKNDDCYFVYFHSLSRWSLLLF